MDRYSGSARGAQRIGHDGNAGRIGRGSRGTVALAGRVQHFIAQFLTREDQCALLREEGIAARVVRVDVRVDQNTNGRGAERSDRLQNLFVQLLVLGVDHQDAVRTEEHGDPAAGRIRVVHVKIGRTLQNVKV